MYNPWNGLFYWKIKSAFAINIGDIAGTKNKKGYIEISIDYNKRLAHRLAWFYIKGYMPENTIDHKDRIKHHNWWSNLREASIQCQNRNQGNRKDNISGVKGVNWNKSNSKWIVQMSINSKKKFFGYHYDFDEAVCHRLAAEQCINWTGCDSCSPAYKYVTENIQGGEVCEYL